MREDRSPLILAVLLVLSIGMHGVAFITLGFLSLVPSDFGPRSVIAFVIETPEPLPPEPEPPPQPPLPPPPPPAAAPRVRRPPPPPDEPPPPPPEATPAAFDNVTFTNDAPSTFTMPESSGIAAAGPIGPPGPRVGLPGGVPGGTGTAPSTARVVAAANLSRGPRPPRNADAILVRYFPNEERDQGIEGEANVRVTLGPDGRATNVQIVSSSRRSFGDACRRMLQDRQMLFTPPLDRQGNPVSTQIVFTCTFETAF